MDQNFQRQIEMFWAKKFHVPTEALQPDCSYVSLETEEYFADKAILYEFRNHSILRTGYNGLSILDLHAGTLKDTLLRKKDIREKLHQAGTAIKDSYTLLDYFLYSENFKAADQRGILLDPINDNNQIQELLKHCNEEDIENADIEKNQLDPYNFGIITEKNQLAAYASYRMFGGNICDAGVIVHPEHRGIGLGRQVVSTLCEHCLENSVIPMYRVFQENLASQKIPEALGFQLLLSVHSFIF